MFKKNLLLLLLIFPFAIVYGQQQKNKETIAIIDILSKQEAAWNNGNLDSFMLYYWHSPALRFVSKNGVRKGWQAVYDSYKKNYSDKDEMGKLGFEIKSIDLIDKENAMVVGSWKVENKSGSPAGYFSLWFKKIGGEWFIIMDHTS